MEQGFMGLLLIGSLALLLALAVAILVWPRPGRRQESGGQRDRAHRRPAEEQPTEADQDKVT